jgi:D-aminopeptidase
VSTAAGIDGDLNTVIQAAVTARVESAVLEALSGDETIGRMVAAALQQVVEVKTDGGYRTAKVPFINHLIATAIRDATKAAVARVLTEEAPTIEDEVRRHIKRAAPEFAAKMVGQVVEAASKNYGVQVTLRMPGE